MQKGEPIGTKITEPKLDSLFKELSSSPDGLSSTEAKKRIEQNGPNALEEKKQSAWLKFLSYHPFQPDMQTASEPI